MRKQIGQFENMSLGWFGDPEDPNYRFAEEPEEDFELIFDPEPEEEGPDPEDLQRQLESTKAELEAQKARMEEIEAIRQGFERVGGKIEDVQRANQAPVQAPAFDYGKFKQEIDDGFMESPTSALDKYFQMKMQPEVQRLMGNNLANSKRFTELDEGRRETYRQYQSEIEAEVQGLPPQSKLYDPDVYQKAHDRVVSRHMNEIIDARVKQALEKAAPEGTGPGPGPSSGPYSETSERRPGPEKKKPKRIVPTEEERALIQRMRLRGTPEEQIPGIIARRRQIDG